MKILLILVILFSILFAEELTLERCRNDPSLATVPGSATGQQELCSLCTLITRNRYSWNWSDHPSSLCTGAPPHLQSWCEYFACQMMDCPSFAAGACEVLKGGNDEFTRIAPCPSRYLCFKCLSRFFQNQVLGCFDNFYDRL